MEDATPPDATETFRSRATYSWAGISKAATMFSLRSVVVGLCASCAFGFVAPVQRARAVARSATVLDPYEEIRSTLLIVEETQLLSKIAELGLLTKLEKAGLKLRDVEPLLVKFGTAPHAHFWNTLQIDSVARFLHAVVGM